MTVRNTPKKVYFDLLTQGHRSLGEGNELILLGKGPGSWGRLLFGLLFMVFAMIGAFKGLGDLVISLNGKTTKGLVTEVNFTNSEINEREVYRIKFNYEVDEKPFHAFCYSTRSIPNEGDSVEVTYSRGLPHLARVASSDLSYFGFGGMFIFLAILLPFALWGGFGLRKTLRWRQLLINGKPGWATLREHAPTGTLINEMPVIRFTFDYEVDGKHYELVFKSHLPEELDRLSDEDQELIIYHPDDPAKAMFWDELPLQISLNRNGSFIGPSSRLVIRSLCFLFLTYVPMFYAVLRIAQVFRT